MKTLKLAWLVIIFSFTLLAQEKKKEVEFTIDPKAGKEKIIASVKGKTDFFPEDAILNFYFRRLENILNRETKELSTSETYDDMRSFRVRVQQKQFGYEESMQPGYYNVDVVYYYHDQDQDKVRNLLKEEKKIKFTRLIETLAETVDLNVSNYERIKDYINLALSYCDQLKEIINKDEDEQSMIRKIDETYRTVRELRRKLTVTATLRELEGVLFNLINVNTWNPSKRALAHRDPADVAAMKESKINFDSLKDHLKTLKELLVRENILNFVESIYYYLQDVDEALTKGQGGAFAFGKVHKLTHEVDKLRLTIIKDALQPGEKLEEKDIYGEGGFIKNAKEWVIKTKDKDPSYENLDKEQIEKFKDEAEKLAKKIRTLKDE